MKFNLCIVESLMGKYGIGTTEICWKKFGTREERKEYIKNKLEKRYDYVEVKGEETNEDVNALYVVAESDNIG